MNWEQMGDRKENSNRLLIIFCVLHLIMGLALLFALWFLYKKYEFELVNSVSMSTISLMILLKKTEDS